MDKLDEWLNNPKKETKNMNVKRKIPWTNIVLGSALVVCLLFIYQRRDSDPTPTPPEPVTVSVVEFVELAGRDYNLYLSQTFDELSKQVDTKKVNNDKELLPVVKEMTRKNLVDSIGRINTLDEENMPTVDEKVGQWSDEQREQVKKYLKEKSMGHLKASK